VVDIFFLVRDRPLMMSDFRGDPEMIPKNRTSLMDDPLSFFLICSNRNTLKKAPNFIPPINIKGQIKKKKEPDKSTNCQHHHKTLHQIIVSGNLKFVVGSFLSVKKKSKLELIHLKIESPLSQLLCNPTFEFFFLFSWGKQLPIKLFSYW
jgi:hypothetical protein